MTISRAFLSDRMSPHLLRHQQAGYNEIMAEHIAHAAHTSETLLRGLNDTEKKFAPADLFTAGDISHLELHPRVCVIGSRRASERGLALAHDVATTIAQLGGVVVSGLAQGIDTAAHNAAIDAGGKTIAVVGTPLSGCYPKENQALQDRLKREQLVISQFECGSPVQKKNFVLRNRTMALVSDASIIIEAGERSGTEHQAWEAIRLGRPLFVSSLLVATGFEWVSKLMHYGAIAFDSASDLVPFFDEFLPSLLPSESRELPF